ncbi:hypothetical protein Pcinc_021594 [Petrolisthes cinctipes]|uniref:Condensin complex subunit 1 C-terminal domain-containing protein n=1 Tax=Petrolisthes cinctipes TaxID=88211 RepID=A0AAE1FJN6_PETCI|nr:hypothetical protein Pcinc_021594 [Petrolisthes cinctipes]
MAEAAGVGRMLQVLEFLSKFSLEKLDHNWVKRIIDCDFTETEDLPPEFEEHHFNTNIRNLFDAVNSVCRQWVDTIPPVTEEETNKRRSALSIPLDDETSLFTRFWVELSKDVKGLMALIFHYSCVGQRYDARESDRDLGTQAASLYFLILSIPGSTAFRFFHPVLYLKALDILRLSTKLRVGLSSPKKNLGGPARGIQRSRSQSQDDHLLADVDDEEEAESVMLTPVEAQRLIRTLNILLNDLLKLTERFSLKHSAECLDESIGIVIEVSRSETHNAQAIFVGRHGPATVTALAYNAYVAIQSFCNPIHGKVEKTVVLIMKHIMHNILMNARGTSDLSTRSLGVIRDHSQIFVKYLLTQVREDAHQGVYILIQQLCIRVPDRAEFRQKTSQSVVEILRYLPVKVYIRLMKWFFKFSHNEKAGHRLFMLEVISKMLGEEERQVDGDNKKEQEKNQQQRHSCTPIPEEEKEKEMTEEYGDEERENSFLNVTVDHPVEVPPDRNILSHKFLLSIIFSRCRDNAASVRSKALALLAECTFSTNPTITLAMKHIFLRQRPTVFTTPHISPNNINIESPLDLENDLGEEDEDLHFPNASMVVAMLLRRAQDDKVTVRKSALQVVENLMRLDNEMLSEKNLEVLVEHCRDPALVMRKQMLTSLTALLECYPEHDTVTAIWCRGVLPLVLDPEARVQERVIEIVDQVMLRRMVVEGHPQGNTPAAKLPWRILTTLTKCTFHKFLNKVLQMWSKSELMSPYILTTVKTHIGHENDEEAWTLLALLSAYMTIEDAGFALDYFEQHCQGISEIGSYTLLQVLRVVCNSIRHVPGDRAESLQQQLLRPVSSFTVGAELISSMMDTVTLLSYTLHGEEEKGQKAIEKWAAPLLTACDDHLKLVLFETSDPLDKKGEEKLFRHLFTLGEAAMLCPQKVNKRMFLMLQSIIFSESEQGSGVGRKQAVGPIPSSQTQSSQPTTIAFHPTKRVQALAVVTLGKMFLQHEEQAKRIIPALGKMLDTTKHSALKINIVFTLADMCVRYATLVDPLMPQVTACLRDPCLQVRRTTLTLLINLLQEDYLKLKGSFFYRILQCLTDDDEEIRSTATFYVTERLLKRFPKILCQHFIECIFHYNCYEEHESYNRFSQSVQEKKLFSLAGKEHWEERHTIYHFMLDHMPDDQRFLTTQRLCQDVLGGVVDGRIKLTPSSLPMLEDTLTILRSDEIKLASLKSRPEDNDHPTDQEEQAVMAGMAVKKKIISQVVKCNMIENIVPIMIAVKHKLEEQRSPLMKHLLLFFKEIMKDYKNEVKEILAGDKQLAKEIEFDLRRFDQEQWTDEGEVEKEKKEHQQKIDEKETGSGVKVPKVGEKGNKALNDSDGSSPLPDKQPDQELDNVPTPRIPILVPVTPAISKNQLLRLTKEVSVARRMSVAGNLPPQEQNVGKSQRRVSIADFRNSQIEPETKTTDDTHVDPRPICTQEPIAAQTGKEKEKTHTPHKGKTREELLRAVSTPHGEQSVINNITFIDETQELSAIGINATTLADIDSADSAGPKLLLHLTSPEAFAKESDFSRLRKTNRNLNPELRVGKKSKKSKERRTTGGLFESYTEVRESEAESLDGSDVSTASAQSFTSMKASKKKKASSLEGKKSSNVKRTRDMASLSPDPAQTRQLDLAPIRKPIQKKSKSKK